MKSTVIALTLAFASLNPAMVQDAPAEKQMRFLLGASLTFGGERLVTAGHQDEIDMDIRAGGSVALTAGVDYRVNNTLSLQATLGYHIATNSFFDPLGDVRFRRYPIELLAYYQVCQSWRLGGEVRYLSNPTLKADGWYGGQEVSFDNTVSAVAEAEYSMGRHVGLKVRYVHETIKGKELINKVDGSHVGIFASYYF